MSGARISTIVIAETLQFALREPRPTQQSRTTKMEMPTQAVPTFWGAIGGAAAVAIVGFSYGGWVTAGTAETPASQRASKAVVAALAPICVENFNRDKDAVAQLVELKKVKSWEHAAFITKGGWAAIPGATAVDNAMATSCAEMIVSSKS